MAFSSNNNKIFKGIASGKTARLRVHPSAIGDGNSPHASISILLK
jgi:hypothetical protein